jgi:site-specific DNA recombinase
MSNREFACSSHPAANVRLTEAELNNQILSLFRRVRQPDNIRDMFLDALMDWSKSEQEQSRRDTNDLQRQLTVLRQQQDQLLNLRLLQEVEGDTFSRKRTELRDRIATLTAQLQAADTDRVQQAQLAAKVFEHSQGLEQKWVDANHAEKRQLLDLLCLNFRLDGTNLVPQMNKPFDILAERLLVSSNPK